MTSVLPLFYGSQEYQDAVRSSRSYQEYLDDINNQQSTDLSQNDDSKDESDDDFKDHEVTDNGDNVFDLILDVSSPSPYAQGQRASLTPYDSLTPENVLLMDIYAKMHMMETSSERERKEEVSDDQM